MVWTSFRIEHWKISMWLGLGTTGIDSSCAGLVSTVVWLSQINRQEQSDGIERRLYFNALMKMLK